MRQRGFAITPLVYLLAALAVIGALAGLYAAVRHGGVVEGRAEIQAKWDAKNEEDRRLNAAREQDVSDAIKEKDAQRSSAAQAAATNDAKWKEQERESRRLLAKLASCPAGSPASPVVAGDSVASPPSGGGVRLHWRFVGMFIGPHTGSDGQPLFKPATEFALAPERADQPSPYTLGDVIEVEGENAMKWSQCRRDLNSLIDKVNAASDAWDKAR